MQPQLMKRMRRLQSKGGGGSCTDWGMRDLFFPPGMALSRVWIVVEAVVVVEVVMVEVMVWAVVSAIAHRRVFDTIIVSRGRAAKVVS